MIWNEENLRSIKWKVTFVMKQNNCSLWLERFSLIKPAQIGREMFLSLCDFSQFACVSLI